MSWASAGLAATTSPPPKFRSIRIGALASPLITFVHALAKTSESDGDGQKEEDLEAIREERAAKAERELLEERQHTANRDITPEDQRAISRELKVFAGQHAEIDLFPVNFESRWVAGQISGILLNAKWDIPPVDVRMLSKPPDPMVQGVLIRSTGDKKSKAAATELYRLLGNTVASGVFDPAPLPNPERPQIWILVGDKPTPLRSWVK